MSACIDGATKDYKFGQKNNWRRWLWNNIVKRKIDKPLKECLVLYLAGESDLDRKVAVEKGFHPNNLIAVEKDKQVVKSLRDRGVICIHGDFIEVLKAFYWTDATIDVLIADFCGGFTNKNTKMIDALCAKYLPKQSLVALNLLRGRESGNAIPITCKYEFEKLATMRKEHRIKLSAKYKIAIPQIVPDDPKNRASMFWKSASTLWTYDHLELFQAEKNCVLTKNELLDLKDSLFDKAITESKPKFRSYNSGTLVYDSVLFSLIECMPQYRMTPESAPESWSLLPKIRAALAIRTQRMNGTLPMSPNE